MSIRSDIVTTAKSYLGVVGGSSRHKEIVDTYNSHKPLARGYALKTTDDWCAGFISAVAILTENTDIISTEVSVPQMVSMAQANGTWVESDDFVPCEMSRICYEACSSQKKQLVTVPGAGHGLSYPVDPDGYLGALREFFADI